MKRKYAFEKEKKKFRKHYPASLVIVQLVTDSYEPSKNTKEGFEKYREDCFTVLLLYLQGRSPAEISKTLNISFQAVYLRMNKFFKEYLKIVYDAKPEILNSVECATEFKDTLIIEENADQQLSWRIE